MSSGISNLGGATLDLAGGTYSLSAPLLIPQMYGNLRIIDGTLRAHPTFPPGGTVLQVGASPCTVDGQKSCNENVALSGLVVDGGHIAAGCIAINSTMGATLDSSSAVFGFSGCGIAINGGHETMVEETWVAAYFWSDKNKEHTDSTGICVNGNDHYLTNIIVFSARTGVAVSGAANLLSGVHTWNCATGNGGVGVLNSASQNRFEGCYFDYTDLRLTVAVDLTIASSFFLGNAQLEFRAPAPASEVRGVYISGSAYYSTTAAPFLVNETQGTWTSISDFVVEGLLWGGSAQPRAGLSRASKAWQGRCADGPMRIDFSDVLAFPSALTATRTISSFSCDTAYKPCGVAVLALAQPDTRAAVVQCEGGGNVSFTVTVDQSVDSALGWA